MVDVELCGEVLVPNLVELLRESMVKRKQRRRCVVE